MSSNEERMRILEEVESGKLSPDKAASRILDDKGDTRKEKESPASPMEVLEDLENGKIDTDEAAKRLKKSKARSGPLSSVSTSEWVSKSTSLREEQIQRWWLLPFWGGVVLTVLSGLWMASRLQGGGMDFWFFFAWLPLALGVLLIVLAWASNRSTWLSVRIRSKEGDSVRKFYFHFPLPIGVTRWGLHRFRHKIAGVNGDQINSLLDSLDNNNGKASPIIVRVNDDDDDDHVEIVIG